MALTSRIQATRFVGDGSTFRTVDTDALVTTDDRSFRPVDMAVGPDGADLRRRLVRHPDGSHRSAGHVGQVLRPDLAAASEGLAAGAASRPGRAEQWTTRAAARRPEKVVPGPCAAAARRTSRSGGAAGAAAAGARGARAARARSVVDRVPDRGHGPGMGAAADVSRGRRRFACGPFACCRASAPTLPALRENTRRTRANRAGPRGQERAGEHGRSPRARAGARGAAGADTPAGRSVRQARAAADLVDARGTDHARRRFGAELAGGGRAVAGAAVHRASRRDASRSGWPRIAAIRRRSRASIPMPTGRRMPSTRAS